MMRTPGVSQGRTSELLVLQGVETKGSYSGINDINVLNRDFGKVLSMHK